MKILAITQARYGSSRLPGKILKEIKGQTLLELHINRIKKSKLISKLKVATTNEPDAFKIEDICKKLNVDVYKGSLEDVLERFYFTAKPENPDWVVRLTSDCPLIDSAVIDSVINFAIKNSCDYVSNTLNPTFPDGVDVEVFKYSALEKAYNEATLMSDREHVTPYIWRNSTFKGGNIFKSMSYENKTDNSLVRLTVDTLEDFLVIERLVNSLGIDKPWEIYVKYLKNHIDIESLNRHFIRNEGYQKSLNEDKIK
jgi:spore coat polysaccharide biosynthesis protein SpsF (cytidylyltransferase family)